MEREHIAEAYFKKGYNCAQAVVLAFKDELGKSEGELAALASSFGGGLARMREVCGAVSGAALVFGMLHGFADPTDQTAKKEHYRFVQEFAERFKARSGGSIICRELLRGGTFESAHDLNYVDNAPIKKLPCVELVKLSAAIADEMLR
ncbi:MAG: C-GCAxxG-C-C family protein [Clostridiaceae bacterium]|jgi:C_GCAxxG_C_C family probable redox protein|nr:C-GCAxxG-C-C family protein [Clostridiaceae bacterium]